MNITFTAPIETRCENNRRDGHWRQRATRVAKQRGDFAIFARMALRGKMVTLPCAVTFTRIAPRSLDPGDNLNSAFKHLRDQLAEMIGFNDRTDLVMWHYKQERGAPNEMAVRVEIETT